LTYINFGAKTIAKAGAESDYRFNVVSEYSIQVLAKFHGCAKEDDRLTAIVKIGIYMEENLPSAKRLNDLMNQV